MAYQTYVDSAMSVYTTHLHNSQSGTFSWDDAAPLALVNLAKLTSETAIVERLDQFVKDQFLNRGTTSCSDCEFPWIMQWGNNRYASNLAYRRE